jgi:hypothetical protein
MRKDVTPRNTLLDVRVVARNIEKGILTQAEYQDHLTKLPDVGANSIAISARLGEDDTIEEDSDDDES